MCCCRTFKRIRDIYSYYAALEDLGPLQGHRDAVEKDKDQNHVVKELVGDYGLAEQSEPADEEKRV